MKKIKKVVLAILFLGMLIVPNISVASTLEELTVMLNSLLAQVKVLQEQIAQQAQAKPVAWCHNFDTNLKYGDSGEEITALQTVLEKQGLYKKGTNPPHFDEQVASAVSGFQMKYKKETLDSWGLQYGTGFVGKTTRKKLNQLYGCGVITIPVVDGTCGSANKQTFSSEPTTNLCKTGVASDVFSQATTGLSSDVFSQATNGLDYPTFQYVWTCAGLEGGSTASCSAYQSGINPGCATEGNLFSVVYKNIYPEKCCAGLTEWWSRMDTRKVVNGVCVETGMVSGYPVGTCLNCGNGVCESIENVCNCPQDCSSSSPSPVITGVSGPTNLNTNQAGTWTIKAYDPDGTSLSYSVDWGEIVALTQGTVNKSETTDQTATFSHTYSNTGNYTVTFIVKDSSGLSAKSSITVNVGVTVTTCTQLYGCGVITIPVVDGTCGSANKQTFSSEPTTNLCKTGVASQMLEKTSIGGVYSVEYVWTCAGLEGGSKASCGAYQILELRLNGTLKSSLE